MNFWLTLNRRIQSPINKSCRVSEIENRVSNCNHEDKDYNDFVMVSTSRPKITLDSDNDGAFVTPWYIVLFDSVRVKYTAHTEKSIRSNRAEFLLEHGKTNFVADRTDF